MQIPESFADVELRWRDKRWAPCAVSASAGIADRHALVHEDAEKVTGILVPSSCDLGVLVVIVAVDEIPRHGYVCHKRFAFMVNVRVMTDATHVAADHNARDVGAVAIRVADVSNKHCILRGDLNFQVLGCKVIATACLATRADEQLHDFLVVRIRVALGIVVA